MSTSDLDVLRGRWTAASRRVDQHLQLNVAAMRTALSERTERAFRRHSRWLLAALVGGGATVLALTAFIVAQRHDALYVVCAVPLLALLLTEFIVDLRQWRTLARLDFTTPVLTLLATLDTLRARRLRITKCIFLTSVLLWWPAIAVLLRGLFGADLLRGVDPSVWWVSLAVGVLFIPLGGAIAHLVSRRFGTRPGFQRFLDEVAGNSWSRAQREFDAHVQFERDVESGDLDRVAAAARPRGTLPPMLVAPLRSLRWRIVAGIVLCVGAMLAIGLFNAMHGGQWQFIVPGIVLNLVCVAQLVPGILALSWTARLDYGAPGIDLVAALSGRLALRARVARATLIGTPLIAVLLAQVLMRATLGVDLFDMLGVVKLALTALAAIAAGGALYRVAPRQPESALLNAFALGALSSIRRVLKVLTALSTAEPASTRDSSPASEQAR